MRLLALFALLVWLPLAGIAQTQDETDGQTAPAAAATSFDEEAFSKLLERATEVVERGEASTEALETLRQQLTAFRSAAADRKAQAQVRVQPIRDRLEALGAPPADGETEPDDVAALRDDLNRQLRAARAPVVAADDAFNQADTLIKRIDGIIRDRTTSALLEYGPTPLNPVRWVAALGALRDYSRNIVVEVSDNWANPTQQAVRVGNLPVAAILFGLALLLLVRARRWSRELQEWLSRYASQRAAATYSFFGALFQIVLPTLGLVLLVQAFSVLDLFGLRGFFLVRALGVAGFALYFSSWVARLLFTPTEKFPALIEVDPRRRSRLRNAFMLLGLTFALRSMLQAISESVDFGESLRDASTTLLFPVVVLGGVALVRIGWAMRQEARQSGARETGNPFLARVGALMGSFCLLAGILGPVLSAVGYSTAGATLVFSTGLSLLLIAGFYILFRLLGSITGGGQTATVISAGAENEQQRQGALLRVSIGFLFIITAIPLLLLIWGMRRSELLETWLWLRDGITIGDTRFSLTDFLTFVLVFAVGYTLTRLVQSALRTTVMPNTRLDVGGQNAITTGTGYVGIFLSALAAISATGLDLSSLAIVAGALSVGIGFGLQTIVSNFVSGIILLVERPIKLGDWIEVGAYSGYVRKISVRSTEVETFDRANIIIPNADLIAGSVTNWTHSSMAGRVRVPVGVSYNSDPRHVERVLREIAESHPMVLLEPAPVVMFMGFGADSLNFELRAILRDVNWMLSSASDMNYEIARRFREEGIEIPFAQRDVYIKNLSDLRPGAPMADSRTTADERGEADAAASRSPVARSREEPDLREGDGTGASAGGGTDGEGPAR